MLVKSLFHEGVTSALHPYICKDISLELNYTWHVLQTAMFELSLTPLYTINKSTFLLHLHKPICYVNCNFFSKNSGIRLWYKAIKECTNTIAIFLYLKFHAFIETLPKTFALQTNATNFSSSSCLKMFLCLDLVLVPVLRPLFDYFSSNFSSKPS